MRKRLAAGSATVVLIVAAALPYGLRAQNQHSRASDSEHASVRILPAPASFHFPDRQKLVYSVQWHMLNAGTATILARPSEGGEQLTSTADSTGMANHLYPVHDHVEALIDPRTFCTQSIAKHNEEGPRRLERNIHFNYSQTKSEIDDRDLKNGRTKHAEFHIPDCVTDLVAGFFYVSSLPLGPGFSETFPLNDGGETTVVRVQVEGREKVQVPSGQFSTLRVKAQPILGPMQGKGAIWAWVAEDPRLPVEIKSKLGVVTLVFRLQRIERAPPQN